MKCAIKGKRGVYVLVGLYLLRHGLSSGSVLCCSFVASRSRTGRVRIGWSLFITPSPWTGGHGGTKSSNLSVNQLVPGVLAWH